MRLMSSDIAGAPYKGAGVNRTSTCKSWQRLATSTYLKEPSTSFHRTWLPGMQALLLMVHRSNGKRGMLASQLLCKTTLEAVPCIGT